MSDSLRDLMERMRDLQDAVESEMAEKRKKFKYSLQKRKVVFEADVLRRHKQFKIGLGAFLKKTSFLTLLTAPIIYGVIVPLVFLDVVSSIFQAVCFPVYGIGKVRRQDYIFLDRGSLAYLNGMQKLNCAYCGYGNGVLAFVSEIAARTEQYWCPIKHAARVSGAHGRYAAFLDYGDAEGFQKGLQDQRDKLKAETLAKGD
jgi:hypothetical protein